MKRLLLTVLMLTVGTMAYALDTTLTNPETESVTKYKTVSIKHELKGNRYIVEMQKLDADGNLIRPLTCELYDHIQTPGRCSLSYGTEAECVANGGTWTPPVVKNDYTDLRNLSGLADTVKYLRRADRKIHEKCIENLGKAGTTGGE